MAFWRTSAGSQIRFWKVGDLPEGKERLSLEEEIGAKFENF